jgi:neutral ceramidase
MHQISNESNQSLTAGGASFDITPPNCTFLYGYPHTPRLSTGVHDPLLASTLYLDDGTTAVVFVQVDLIWLPKWLVAYARAQIALRTGIFADHIMVTASHTHSGRVTLSMISNADDSVVPPPDPDYLKLVVEGIVGAPERAKEAATAPSTLPTMLSGAKASAPHIHKPTTTPGAPTLAKRPAAARRYPPLGRCRPTCPNRRP